MKKRKANKLKESHKSVEMAEVTTEYASIGNISSHSSDAPLGTMLPKNNNNKKASIMITTGN